MTGEEAKGVVKLLLASYPTQRQRLSADDIAEMTRAYAMAFRQIAAEQVRQAVTELVLTEKWLPSIATVVARVAEVRDGRKRDGGEAWGDVLAAVRKYGSWRTPGVDFKFADPIAARAVKSLGWSELCASENAVSDRARFIELYAQLAANDASDRAVAGALPGKSSKELPSGTRSLADAIGQLQLSGGDK
jgi:hypothetical protein